MALTPRHGHYLVIVTLIGVFSTGCSTNSVKETPPTDKQSPPQTCPLAEENPSTHHRLSYHLIEKSTLIDLSVPMTDASQRFAESFAFRYDTVVDNLLKSPNIPLYPQIKLPQDDLIARLDDMSQDVLANYRLQGEKKTDEQQVVNLLDRSENFKQIETLLNKARHFVGVPYRYGGTSPRGFDCSGLVYYTLKNTGVSVPRTAHAQYLHSTPVKKSELRPGDLVFFRTNRRTRRITHVGIYLGDNRFIHARSGGKKVDITKLSNRYYSTRFVRGGRVL
jgi:hypothetical protein